MSNILQHIFLIRPLIIVAPSVIDQLLDTRDSNGPFQDLQGLDPPDTSKTSPAPQSHSGYLGNVCHLNANLFDDGTRWYSISDTECSHRVSNQASGQDVRKDVIKTDFSNDITVTTSKDLGTFSFEIAGVKSVDVQFDHDPNVTLETDTYPPMIQMLNGRPVGFTQRNAPCSYMNKGTIQHGNCFAIDYPCRPGTS